MRKQGFYPRYGKRLLDLCLAAPAAVALAPAIAAVAVAVRVSMGSPVLFRQQRPGRYGAPFYVLKFRTMRNAHEADGNALADDERLTTLGRLLRRLSLDELPQLVNVLNGEMSLVGPRPLLMEYLERYSAEQARRHEVKPGITGWAQIHGRNALDWQERFRLDVWYVDNWNLLLDLKILLRTITYVLKREGINQPGRATTDYFQGNPAAEESE